jgi:TnpA family transposase
MSDTAGSSEIVFGLFWLLGFQFSPRLADIGGTQFGRINPQADSGVLDHLARHRVNLERIRGSWDDLLRVVGSLKMGTVSASELMRSLLNTERPSTLAKTIADLGRIPKTLHPLRLIDDKTYRRGILTQLNRGEGAMLWPEKSFTAAGVSCASVTAKGRKISSMRSVWSSTCWCCGIRSICKRRWISSVPRDTK